MTSRITENNRALGKRPRLRLWTLCLVTVLVAGLTLVQTPLYAAVSVILNEANEVSEMKDLEVDPSASLDPSVTLDPSASPQDDKGVPQDDKSAQDDMLVQDGKGAQDDMQKVVPLAVGNTIDGLTITHVIDTASYTVSVNGVYEVVGTFTGSSSPVITVNAGLTNVVLVFNNTKRENSFTPLDIKGNSKVKIHLASNTVNTLTSNGSAYYTGANQAGISVPQTATLTIAGTGALEVSGSYGSAGIGGIYTSTAGTRSGDITIESGIVIARGGDYAAGIGGGRAAYGGKTTINGGTVEAYGGYGSGSGIGGGGQVSTGGQCLGGQIYIHGGNVVARAYGSSAAIGGGFNSKGEYIEITGGTVNAQTQNAGTGIGAGGGSDCGTINISGGTIFAKGSNLAAGIGTGNSGTGSINISGGIIHAESLSKDSSGVGGGVSGSAVVNIFGGSVYSINPSGMVRVNSNPKNGPAHGNALVYLVGVKLVNETGGILPHSSVSITVQGSSSYAYHATTNDQGIAYMWLPEGNHEYLLTNPDNGAYLDGSIQVVRPKDPAEYDPATNTAEMPALASSRTFFSYGTTHPNEKVYGSAAFALDITHGNVGDFAEKGIQGVEWYRESLENPTGTEETFEQNYAAAAPSNKGTGGVGSALNLISSDGRDSHIYSMTMENNGRYWFRIHFKGAVTGMDIYQTAYLDVGNVYTPLSIYVRDWNTSNSEVLAPYKKLGNATQVYGVPYDFDGTRVLEAPTFGYDQLQYARNTNAPATHWLMKVPGAPFQHTLESAPNATLTLDTQIDDSEDKTQISSGVSKFYTVNYTRKNTGAEWTETKVSFVDIYGNSIEVPKNSGVTSDNVAVPLDMRGTTSTNFKGNGGKYAPPTDGIYRVVGWYISNAPHGITDPLIGSNPDVFVAQPDFSSFNPSLSFSDVASGTLAGNNKLFVVYTKDYMVEVSVPVKLLFAAFESDKGEVTSPAYFIKNNGETDIEVTLSGFEVSDSAGVSLVNNPASDGQLGLKLKSYSQPNLFPEVSLASAQTQSFVLGTLGDKDVTDGSDRMGLKVGGKYIGSFDVSKQPRYMVVFEFEVVKPGK